MEAIWALLGFQQKTVSGKGTRPAQALPETESVLKIVRALEGMDPIEARFLAAFAYLLTRVADADRGMSQDERKTIEDILCDKGKLTAEHAALVAEIARNQTALFGSTENFLVGREFDRIATYEQKIALLHCLYAVSAADKSISSVEDHEIRKISRELRLSHEDYISVRLAYREHLGVLKTLPGSSPTKS